MNILEMFLKSRVLDHKNAAGFMASVEALAKDAGITKPLTVRHASTGIANAAYHPFSNTLFVTDGILKLMGSRDLSKPASAEMHSVLAHEMGHAKFAAKHFAPLVLLTGGLNLVVLASSYMIENTYARMKKTDEKEAGNPANFWAEFQNICDDASKRPWDTFKDFAAYIYPIPAKLLHADRYKDETWAKTLFDQAKIMSINAMSQLSGMAACRPVSLRNEWEADKFMLALTQDKQACLSAFNKLKNHSVSMARGRSKTPLQKNVTEKIESALQNFMQETVMAHPSFEERINYIKSSSPIELARGFGL